MACEASGGPERRAQVERLLCADQCLDQPQRHAAQPERVGAAGRREADRKQPHQAIQPVGDPQRQPSVSGTLSPCDRGR